MASVTATRENLPPIKEITIVMSPEEAKVIRDQLGGSKYHALGFPIYELLDRLVRNG